MTEKVLPYNRAIVPQETGWWCGPASTQVLLDGVGIRIAESVIAAEVEQLENPGRGDDRDGTDYIGLLEQVLDRKVPHAKFTSVYTPADPMTAAQKERFWQHLTASIDAGYGVIANIVAPPSNPPKGVKGSTPPPYPKWGTTWHYVSIMGYEDALGARAVWIADSANFGGISGFWCPFDGPGSICSLIPPKGYCYAAAEVKTPAPQPPKASALTAADRYAQAIIGEGKRRGITRRGIEIALSTALVESNLRMYANAKVPESMSLPHDAVGSDAYSVGLFQQQVVRGPSGWWWGDAATCMDPALSAGLFYDRLATYDYNNTAFTPGWFAAEIQRPAAQYRGRYDERMGEAARIYDRLANQTDAADSFEELLMIRVPSMSIYAEPGEPDVLLSDMIRAFDAHGSHEDHIEKRAKLGDPEALFKVARTAAGRGVVKEQWAITQACDVLAEIKGVTPEDIRNQLRGTAA